MIIHTQMCLLIPEGASPKLCSICLSDAEVVTLKQTIGEDGLQLSQHVAEDQRQLGKIPPVEVRKRGKTVRFNMLNSELLLDVHQTVQRPQERNAE